MHRSILVIDDDVAVQNVLVQHLSNGYIDVCTAADGESGVALAKQCKPDFILLDVDMPGIDGHEVCRRLKFDPATQGIPIAFLTASASVSDRIIGLDHGAVDYIAKPFDPFEVAARMRVAFRTQAMVEKARINSNVDQLTGLRNHRAFEEDLQAELARAHRSAESLACIVFEIDQFDEMARSDGGKVRDEVLCDVADMLKNAFRTEDRLFRYADRQFAIIAPNVSACDAMTLTERMQWAVQGSPALRHRTSVEVTLSIGLAISRLSFGRSVVDEAILALSQAKNAGGNRMVTAGEVIELQLAV